MRFKLSQMSVTRGTKAILSVGFLAAFFVTAGAPRAWADANAVRNTLISYGLECELTDGHTVTVTGNGTFNNSQIVIGPPSAFTSEVTVIWDTPISNLSNANGAIVLDGSGIFWVKKAIQGSRIIISAVEQNDPDVVPFVIIDAGGSVETNTDNPAIYLEAHTSVIISGGEIKNTNGGNFVAIQGEFGSSITYIDTAGSGVTGQIDGPLVLTNTPTAIEGNIKNGILCAVATVGSNSLRITGGEVIGSVTVPSGWGMNIPSGSTFTVPNGSTLTIAAGAALTVQSGAVLDNQGTVDNNGTIDNYGKINGQNINNSGTGQVRNHGGANAGDPGKESMGCDAGFGIAGLFALTLAFAAKGARKRRG
ncbi:MAG: hypothetical protein LBK91_05850 [Synergistaceae bacterium]|jgi:hypothetical protein|nr:hypothetical protein [Synergistaceae bacterium]